VHGAEQLSESKTRDGEARNGGLANGPSKRRLRVLLERLGVRPETASGASYHGFISYSHAADGKLAPAIQKGLQRFAKPWYRVRALHIFRDDASLAANPGLWESITQALDASEHLILLASPQAAGSGWVAKEAAYWREHKSVDTILIALTEGELIWQAAGAREPGGARGSDDTRPSNADSGGSSSGHLRSALPATLDGAFDEEPRFIDLRWAHNATDLSLSHPQWREAIAELAAPLHGKPKDEIASEEVRQHHRAMKIVRIVAAALLTLLVAAVVAGLIAYSQYRSAQARALAAEATAALSSNPEQSLSLALQSTQLNATATGVQALRSALVQAPQRMAIDSGAGAGVQAAWSPDSDQIAITGANDRLQLWDSRSGRVQHVVSIPGSSRIVQLSYSDDGRWLVAVTKLGSVYLWNVATLAAVNTARLNAAVGAANMHRLAGGPFLTAVWAKFGGDGLIVYGLDLSRAIVFDPTTGAIRDLLRLPGDANGVDAVVPSPDESRVFLAYETTKGPVFGASSIVNLKTGTAVALSPLTDMSGHEACWFADSGGFVTWDPTEAQDLNLRWWNGTTGKEVGGFPTPDTITAGACSPSTTELWAATGERGGRVLVHQVTGSGVITLDLFGHSGLITAIASSADGNYMATGSDDGTARIWDTRTGALLRTLNDGNAVTNVRFSPDGGLALTTDQQGIVRIWDSGVGEPLVRLTLPPAGRTYPLGFADQGRVVYGLSGTPHTGSSFHVSLHNGSVVRWDSATGALLRPIPLPGELQLPRPAAGVECNKQGLSLEDCELPPPDSIAVPVGSGDWGLVGVAVNSAGSEVVYANSAGVELRGLNRQRAQLALPQPVTGISFGADKVIAMTDRAVYVWTPLSSSALLRLPQPSPTMDAEVTPDGRRLVTADLDGTVTVWSTSGTQPTAVFHVTRAFAGQVTQVSGGLLKTGASPPVPLRVAISPDGETVAAGTSWQTVFLWDVASRKLIATRFVSAPTNVGAGAAGAATAGGFNGPWSIGQLTFSSDGSTLLATTFPFHGAGDSRAAATTDVISSLGAVLASWAGAEIDGAIDPGVAPDPRGDALTAGVLGVAPGSTDGSNAVYEVANGERLLNLETAALTSSGDYFSWASAPQPWAPNGTDVLAGTGAIYACAACGSLAQLQQAAKTRLKWLAPLSAANDKPPSGNPYR
jgi:WD40 repeat protein